MFSTKKWITKQKTALYLKSPSFTNKFNYMKASIIAILIGFVLGALAVFATGGNGFVYVYTLFSDAFLSRGSGARSNLFTTMNYTTVFIFMGLGLALGFKVGLFNMGGSGQALFGFGTTYLILRNMARDRGIGITELSSSTMVFVFLLFIISGVLISVTTGLLKVYFNIHEVATSIMLNWTIWYIIRWLVAEPTSSVLNNRWLFIGSNGWILGIILALISVALTWFILGYTTIGYKFNMVGKQISAAKYAGVNGNLYIIMTTAVQGLFISIGGLFYFYNALQIQSWTTNVVPTIGFDAISVALVAFNNVIGIIPVAMLWGIINSTSVIAAGAAETSPDLSYVISGIIMYSATIYTLFIKFKPIELIKRQSYIDKDVEIRLLINSNKKKISENRILIRKVKESKFILDLKKETEEKIVSLNNQLIVAKENWNNKNKSDDYKVYINQGKEKIKQLKIQLNKLKIDFKEQINAEKIIQKEKLENRVTKLNSIKEINQDSIKKRLIDLNNAKSKNKLVEVDSLKKEIKSLKANRVMFKSQLIEYKSDFKKHMQSFSEEKKDMIEDVLFKITNAKFKISKTHGKQEILKIKNEIITTKEIFKEEFKNEETKFIKIINELKAENNELFEKGFEKYYNSGLYGISKHFKNLRRDKMVAILNEAVIEESEVTLKISVIKKDSSISKEEKKEQISKLKAELNNKFGEKVQVLKNESDLISANAKLALTNAKSKVNALKAEYKIAISKTDKNEVKLKLKENLFKQIMEVQNEHITIR